MPAQLIFVAQDGFGQASPSQRQVIRSQCMKGRNKRTKSRRSTQERNKKAREQACEESSTTVLETTALSPADATNIVCGESSYGEADWAAAACYPFPPTSSRVSTCHPETSSLRFTALADDLNSESEELISDLLSYGAFRHGAYPIELCVDFKTVGDAYIPWLFEDKAFLHSVLFASSAMHDFSLGRGLTLSSTRRLRKTIAYLNARLAKPESQCSDATLYTVITLAKLAAMFHDDAAAAAHMDGLHRIVDLRGGQKFLLMNPKKHYKLISIDLSWCALSGSNLRFPHSEQDWCSVFSGPFESRTESLHRNILLKSVDERLATVWTDLQRLSSLLNVAFGSGRLLEASSFQHWLSSVQSRLTRLRPAAADHLSDCIRLGMIAFLCAAFRLPAGRMQLYDLALRYRQTLQASLGRGSMDDAMSQWLMVVGTMTAFDAHEEWLQEAWHRKVSADACWPNVRVTFESIMWISCVHDGPGRQAFAALNGPTRV